MYRYKTYSLYCSDIWYVADLFSAHPDWFWIGFSLYRLFCSQLWACGNEVFELGIEAKQGRIACFNIYGIQRNNFAFVRDLICNTWRTTAIPQVTTMLATSKNVLFPCHNHLLTTSTDDPSLGRSWAIIKSQVISAGGSRCLWPGNRTFWEVWLAWWLPGG